MPITDQTLTVAEAGEVTLRVPCAPGTRVRVVVLDLAETAANPGDPAAGPRLFADPAENVWNDL